MPLMPPTVRHDQPSTTIPLGAGASGDRCAIRGIPARLERCRHRWTRSVRVDRDRPTGDALGGRGEYFLCHFGFYHDPCFGETVRSAGRVGDIPVAKAATDRAAVLGGDHDFPGRAASPTFGDTR